MSSTEYINDVVSYSKCIYPVKNGSGESKIVRIFGVSHQFIGIDNSSSHERCSDPNVKTFIEFFKNKIHERSLYRDSYRKIMDIYLEFSILDESRVLNKFVSLETTDPLYQLKEYLGTCIMSTDKNIEDCGMLYEKKISPTDSPKNTPFARVHYADVRGCKKYSCPGYDFTIVMAVICNSYIAITKDSSIEAIRRFFIEFYNWIVTELRKPALNSGEEEGFSAEFPMLNMLDKKGLIEPYKKLIIYEILRKLQNSYHKIEKNLAESIIKTITSKTELDINKSIVEYYTELNKFQEDSVEKQNYITAYFGNLTNTVLLNSTSCVMDFYLLFRMINYLEREDSDSAMIVAGAYHAGVYFEAIKDLHGEVLFNSVLERKMGKMVNCKQVNWGNRYGY